MLRVACNRDERRERPQAHPPFITRAGGLRVLTPQDPQARGTWIAASSAGLVFVLLNANGGAARPVRSRGLVIPAIAGAHTLEDAVTTMEEVRPDDFAPFRLLVIDRLDVAEFRASDGEWHAALHRITHPLLFTSSSLGDAIVDGPRRHLFEQMLAAPWDLAAQQDAYHAHRWRDRPAVSVHMSRPDACTVSTTVVEVTPRQVRMIYQPAHHCEGTPVGLVIDRHDAAAHRTCRQYAAV